MAKYSKSEVAESLAKLREWIKPGDSIYLTVESVARPGMSRWIKPRLIAVRPAGYVSPDPIDFSYPAYHIACVLGLRHDQLNNAVRLDGGATDMVYHLAHVLFGQPGKYEATPEAIEAYHARGFRGRNGEEFETAAEYMLKHRWI